MAADRLARVAVVGTSCTGKTTLARSLSEKLGVPHVELDALYWGPDWTPVPAESFRSAVEEAVAGPCWVIDGNYSRVRDVVWGHATDLIWLDYSFPLVFTRAWVRTLRRIATREPLFAGNRETLALADPEWIPWWVLRTYGRRRREYPPLFARPEFAHLRVRTLTRPAQAEDLLQECASS